MTCLLSAVLHLFYRYPALGREEVILPLPRSMMLEGRVITPFYLPPSTLCCWRIPTTFQERKGCHGRKIYITIFYFFYTLYSVGRKEEFIPFYTLPTPFYLPYHHTLEKAGGSACSLYAISGDTDRCLLPFPYLLPAGGKLPLVTTSVCSNS